MSAFRRASDVFVFVQEALEEIADAFVEGVAMIVGILLALALLVIPFLTVAVLMKALA